MFSFIKQYAEKMTGVEIYPIISMLIFFLFFIALLWFVKRMDKASVKMLSNIPLDDNQ
jgi:flagellar biogenesis protein FliO